MTCTNYTTIFLSCVLLLSGMANAEHTKPTWTPELPELKQIPDLDPALYDQFIDQKHREFNETIGTAIRGTRAENFRRAPSSKVEFPGNVQLAALEGYLNRGRFSDVKARNINEFMARLEAGENLTDNGFVEDYYLVTYKDSAFPYYFEDLDSGAVIMLNDIGEALEEVSWEIVTQLEGRILSCWNLAANGFTAYIPDENLEALKRHPLISGVIPVSVGRPCADQYTGSCTTPHGTVDPGWARNRIDENNRSDEDIYRYHSTGTGGVYTWDSVHVYVFDSGVRSTHVEFNQGSGWTSIGEGFSALTNTTEDFYYHGTAVASMLSGKTYGIAKNVILHPIKISEDSGSPPRATVNALLDSIEWLLQYSHQSGDLAVANISWGFFGGGSLINEAIQNMLNAGIVVVTAAGNWGWNTVPDYPAASPGVITVGGTIASQNGGDAIWSDSNRGPDVDVFAPSANIQVAGIESDTDESFVQGTSFAAPIVAGIAARYLQTFPESSPQDVIDWILATANENKIQGDLEGSSNLLAFFREWWYPLNTRAEWINSDVPVSDDYWFYSSVFNSWVWTGNHLYQEGSDEISVYIAAEDKWIWYFSPETIAATGWERYWVFYDFSVDQYLLISPVSLSNPAPYSYWSFYLPML